MPEAFVAIKQRLSTRQHTWAITGVAGFIGSHLLETLLELNQKVVGLDNFSTGHQENLDEVRALVGSREWRNFRLIHGDIRSITDCREALAGADYVLHQAALGSVPRSLEDPLLINEHNVTGFLNILESARHTQAKRLVFATSSSVYGDSPSLPKVESKSGRPLSPYAVTKCVNELYADVFARCFQFHSIGLRYFNVFGPRQDPEGAYAAVIPRWFTALLTGQKLFINGDGETSRDFCFVANAVQVNLLAALTENPAALDSVYNVAYSHQTSLNELFQLIKDQAGSFNSAARFSQPEYRPFRAGDVRHSLADTEKAQQLLGYQPTHSLRAGLELTAKWYAGKMVQENSPQPSH